MNLDSKKRKSTITSAEIYDNISLSEFKKSDNDFLVSGSKKKINCQAIKTFCRIRPTDTVNGIFYLLRYI
jgi:hypothetical protein